MAKSASNSKHPLKALKQELSSIMEQVYQKGNEALNQASELVTRNLISATPIDSGLTARSWKNITKYNMVKYIFNENVSKSGIPVLNLLEFSYKGKPFAIRTFEQTFSEIESTIINKLNEVN